MNQFETIKAKKHGDTVFVGPRDQRSPPKGEMVIVKRGIKWLYLAKQTHIDATLFREEDPAENYQEKVQLNKLGNGELRTSGYPQLRVYADADDYANCCRDDRLRKEIHDMTSGYVSMNNMLQKASPEQLKTLRDIFKSLEASQ